MLVLTRSVNEGIKIGPDVLVTVVRVGTRTVRLGIEAPPGVVVLREELAERAVSPLPPIAPSPLPEEVEHGAG